MFNKCHGVVLAIAFLTFFAAGSRAAVITFEGLLPGSSQTSYSEDGFTVSSTGASIFVGSPGGPLTSSPWIFPSVFDGTFELTANDGSAFDLFSVDLAPFNSTSGPAMVSFTGMRAGGGTVLTSFTTGSELAFTSFAFGAEFSNLTSVTWTGLANTDNIAVTASPIPEPGTLASLGLLMGALVFRRRRVRQAAA